MTMNWFALTSLFCGVFSVVLAIFAFIQGNKKSYRLLTLFNIAVAIWGFGCFMAGIARTPSDSILACKIADTGGFFIATLFYHLVCSFYNLRTKAILSVGYFQAIVMNVLNWFTDSVMNDTRFVFDVYYVKATPLLTFATLFHVVMAALSFLTLVHFSKTGSEHSKLRTKFVLVGFLIGFVSGTSILLPEFNIDLIYPAGNLGVVIYVLILTYAILQLRIFDIVELAKAAHRDKLAAIGTLATSLNHEIKNPLYVIRGLAESHLTNIEEGIYSDQEAASKKSNEILKKTAEQAARAMEIMQRFALFAKQQVAEKAQMESISVEKVLEDILPLVNHELELDKIRLIRDIPGDLSPVNVDRRHMEEILFNLIVNSCQAMKEGGEIRISAERNNGHVRLMVEDNGPGIPADRLNQIFEPFYTTKQEGTGLGLYVTKQLVERTGGRITVKSKVGHGTSFLLEFKR